MLDLNVGRVSDNGGEMPDDVLHFDLNILPGDVNRSGVVLADDFAAVRKRFFKNTASPVAGTDTDYSPFHDLDGSGAIRASDIIEVKKRFANRLPIAQPTLAGTSVLVDFNRDGRVNALDLGIAKRNLNHTLPLLPVTVLTAQVAFAPGLFSDGDASLTRRLADEILA